MDPVTFPEANLVYQGDGDQVGDLHCRRVIHDGIPAILSVWEPTDEERAVIAAGGKIELRIYNEPIPPVALTARP